MFHIIVDNLLPTLHFCNFEKHHFRHVLLLLSIKWHPYFKEPTSSTNPVGIVSPSKGYPTFKTMRFFMVDVKILSIQSQVADSNSDGGFVLFLLYQESTFARSIHHMNSVNLKQCGYSLKWVCRHILEGKIVTSFSAACLGCCEICMGSWLKISTVSKPPQCRMNGVLSISLSIPPVFPSLSFKQFNTSIRVLVKVAHI